MKKRNLVIPFCFSFYYYIGRKFTSYCFKFT